MANKPVDNVATGSYIYGMAENVQVVGVKELKNNLSAYLKVLDRGGRVLITNHGRVIGELCRPLAHASLAVDNPQLHEWIASARVRPAQPRTTVRPSPVRVPEGTAARLLNEDRGT